MLRSGLGRRKQLPMQIKNHVFVVTGGASGLGAAAARLLVAEGGFVVIADVNRAAGEALAGELGKAARFALIDVTSENDGKAAVELALLSSATCTAS